LVIQYDWLFTLLLSYRAQYASHFEVPANPSCADSRLNHNCWNAAMFVRQISVQYEK
jgi:hypothetical protein